MNYPEDSTRGATNSAPRLPDTLRLGAAHLTVSSLDRSVGFYENSLGLRLHRREDGVAAMGVDGEDLLVLYEEPGARAARPASTTTRCCSPRARSWRVR
jgi:catechol 2,3-dioxygenase